MRITFKIRMGQEYKANARLSATAGVFTIQLNRRTGDTAVGTKYAAIAGLGF